MALPSGQGSGTTQGGAPAGSTGSPSASGATTAPSSLEATPVTSKNLPAATDLVFGDQAYTVAETYRGDGQAPVAACQTMGWQDAGPNAVWTRTYNGKDGRFAGGTSVASFASHADAVAAMERMADGFAGCGRRMVAQNPDLLTSFTEKVVPLTFPNGHPGHAVTLNLTDGETGTRSAVSTGVVATGTHVAIISIRSTDNPRAAADSRPIEDTLARSLVPLAR